MLDTLLASPVTIKECLTYLIKTQMKTYFIVLADTYHRFDTYEQARIFCSQIGSSAQYVSFPMTDMFSYTGEVKAPLYMGNNQYGDSIYKTIFEPFRHEYINHLQKHAGYFVSQPSYYKGMFDILN